MHQIIAENLVKTFRIVERRPGVWGAVRSVVHRRHRIVNALGGISFAIQPGELVGYIGPNGGTETAQYPLVIYPGWFRRFFTYVVPLAGISYYPAMAILDRTDPLGSTTWMQWLSPMAGMAFLLIALRVWNLGVRHCRSTGS